MTLTLICGYIRNMDSTPENVSRLTRDMSDNNADIADQADRLTMIMEAEAALNGMQGNRIFDAGEGSLDGFSYPLEDIEETLAEEDADDASDDPMHSGGISSKPWIPAENAAMHVVGMDEYAGDETDAQRVDPNFDQYDERQKGLTPEDETLMGIDPYESI